MEDLLQALIEARQIIRDNLKPDIKNDELHKKLRLINDTTKKYENTKSSVGGNVECKLVKAGAELKNLRLDTVNQQRELLLAYHKHLDSFNDPTIYNASEGMIDDYLANNCG